MIKHIVVDTSYLLERCKIAGKKTQKCWTEEGHKEVTKKFNEEEKLGSRFYFPIPVLFEFANHINDANNKQQVLHHLMEIIEKTQEDDSFWFITPCSNAEDMNQFMEDLIKIINNFSDEFVQQKLSLTNVSIITEAKRLKDNFTKQRYKKQCEYKVHIWTTNEILKSYEPDTELNPFI